MFRTTLATFAVATVAAPLSAMAVSVAPGDASTQQRFDANDVSVVVLDSIIHSVGSTSAASELAFDAASDINPVGAIPAHAWDQGIELSGMSLGEFSPSNFGFNPQPQNAVLGEADDPTMSMYLVPNIYEGGSSPIVPLPAGGLLGLVGLTVIASVRRR